MVDMSFKIKIIETCLHSSFPAPRHFLVKTFLDGFVLILIAAIVSKRHLELLVLEVGSAQQRVVPSGSQLTQRTVDKKMQGSSNYPSAQIATSGSKVTINARA